MAKTQAEIWNNWLAKLSPDARAALTAAPVPASPPAATDEELLYSTWRKGLSAEAREAVDVLGEQTPSTLTTPVSADVAVDNSGIRFFVLEVMDGEWPVLRAFRTVEGVVNRMRQLEGEDVTFWAFYGAYLPFTRGVPRYVLMPDRVTGITVPLADGMTAQRVEMSLLESVEIQEDGFLGPPELAEPLEAPPTAPVPQPQSGPRAAPPSGANEDDDALGAPTE